MEECDRRNETASANWPSQHIQRPGRVSLSCEKLPSAPRCCPASGFGASSAPGASSPWPPHFLWRRWGWCGYPPPSPSLRLLSPPRSLTHSPSLSLNFLMATSSLVSCKDTWMQSERRGKEEEKWAKMPAGNIKKKREWYVEAAGKTDRTTQGSRFIYALYSHAKGPTASLARFMCDSPAFGWPTDLAEKMRLLQKHCCHSD